MSRGYRSYRGRASKGKIILAVILVLIIFAALGALSMQRYIVYDENGRPFFRLPDGEPEVAPPVEPPQNTESNDLEVIIQEPEAPPLKAFSLAGGPLTLESWEAVRLEAGADYNAVAVTLKDPQGNIYFDSETAVKKAVKTEKDTMEALASVTGDAELHTIARLSCLLDPRASRTDVEGMGLKNTGGYIFYDGNYTAWLDPGKEAARAYLCGLAMEIAELGFDEILLTDTGYPTQGKLDKINYNTDGPIEENLCLLWEALCTALEPYEVTLSIELPETVVAEGAENASGLVLAQAARYADRIYAVTEAERAASLSDLTLQAKAATEDQVKPFVPELAAPDPVWEGDFLLLPPSE